MRGLKPPSQLVSRAGFERRIHGKWTRHEDGKRTNGLFTTRVLRDGRKQVSDGVSTVRARTWAELAKALEL
jgi:hypothetical protein